MIEAQLGFKGKHPFHSAQLNKFHFSQRVIIPPPLWKLFSLWEASFLFDPDRISLIIDSCTCVYLATRDVFRGKETSKEYSKFYNEEKASTAARQSAKQEGNRWNELCDSPALD